MFIDDVLTSMVVIDERWVFGDAAQAVAESALASCVDAASLEAAIVDLAALAEMCQANGCDASALVLGALICDAVERLATLASDHVGEATNKGTDKLLDSKACLQPVATGGPTSVFSMMLGGR